MKTRKILSLILSVVMLLSVVAIVPVSAEEPKAPVILGYQYTKAYQSGDTLVRDVRFVAKGYTPAAFQKLGFEISVEGHNNTWKGESAKVYAELSQENLPSIKASDNNADYLFAYVIKGVPTSAQNFTVSTYAVDVNDADTKVYGNQNAAVGVEILRANLVMGQNLGFAGSNPTSATLDNNNVVNITKSPSDFGVHTHYAMFNMTDSAKSIGAQYKYMRVLYTASENATFRISNGGTDQMASTITVYETAEFGYTGVITLSDEMVNRMMTAHWAAGFVPENDGATFAIKGIYLFTSEADAAAFAPAVEAPVALPMVTLNFAQDGNAILNYNRIDSLNSGNFDYVAFDSANAISTEYVYVRIAYSITGATGNDHHIQLADGSCTNSTTWSALGNTNGEVLSDVATLTNTVLSRFIAGSDYKVYVMYDFGCDGVAKPATADGTCSISAIYFFASEEAANAFELPTA